MTSFLNRGSSTLATALAAAFLATPATGQRLGAVAGEFECGFKSAEYWRQEIHRAVAAGEIEDPARRPLPIVQPRQAQLAGGPQQCLTGAHIFAFEDTQQLLLTNFSNAALLDFMSQGANALLAAHGDNFDFIGFWVNFTPHHTVGAAFFSFVENDVSGIGLDIFDDRVAKGIAGDTIQGFVMMWNINSNFWQPGTGANANFTRLALAQEFEHRFALFLPPLADGRALQGNNGNCGRGFHWNWKTDGQGSGMEIREWVGSNPAQLVGGSITFNTDIGGVFSYTDLYLMGYVSPLEMNFGNSELRYMNTSTCTSSYSGAISAFNSADIIATAGPRAPSWLLSQKDFRTGWVMIHLPGDPPSPQERSKAADILTQHMIDWDFSTLGRGSMDNSLFADDCTCPWDLDTDGTVAVPDLLALLAAWGTDPGGPPDFDGDGMVAVPDLMALLAKWGPCP